MDNSLTSYFGSLQSIHDLDDLDGNDKCCDAPDVFITTEGTIVCRNCGLCFGTELVDQDRRSYTFDEIRSRRRVEPVWRSFGARTMISTTRDFKGCQLSVKKRFLFTKLSKIHNSLISSLERNYWEAKPRLSAIAARLAIPDHIVNTAWKIYSECAKQRLTMGRSIQTFACASLYAAVRVHNFPRLLEEMPETTKSLRPIHQSLSLIIQKVFPRLGLKYKPISPRLLVFRFGNELNISIKVQLAAIDLLNIAATKGLEETGKDPKGLAAAALYICAKRFGERRTQSEIAEVSKITEVTLRTRAKQIRIQIKKAPNALLEKKLT